MKLVRITHSRCHEYDGTEYMLAPDEWEADDIDRKISQVVDEMIEDAKAIKDPPFGEPSFHPPYKDHPTLTVREVEALWQRRRTMYRRWKERNAHLTRSFEQRLCDEGFVALWSEEAVEHIIEADAHWGHSHGLDLNYKHAEPLP